MSVPLGNEVARLAEVLDKLAVILVDQYGDRDWGDRVKRSAAWIRAGDGYGVTTFLGMVWGLDDIAMNEAHADRTYRRLLDEGYRLAHGLRRDAEPPADSSDIAGR